MAQTFLNDNDRSNIYEIYFKKDKTRIPKPLHKRVLLEIPTQTASGILITESRHKDTPEIRKVIAAADDCLWVKEGDLVIISMMNRPEIVYGADGMAYFMIFEHDCTVKYVLPEKPKVVKTIPTKKR